MTIVMITGCRTWANQYLIHRALSGLPRQTTVIHGGCRGADMMADEAARSLGLSVEVFPADWNKHKRKAGPIRNRQMAEKCSRAIAFWDLESAGTRDAIQQVLLLRKTCDVFLPNGRQFTLP